MKKIFKEKIVINKNIISNNSPTYFIADIAANHDGNLTRAKKLIYLAKEAGANAAKFQHFKAESIVSDYGFKNLGSKKSHQSSWKKSVFKTYSEASLNLDWTFELAETCRKLQIDFFTSPYSLEIVDYVNKFVSAYKIGSGDLNWSQIIDYVSKKKKPVFIATGASSIDEIDKAIKVCLKNNNQIILMQCNTNYTAKIENFKYINLNVLNFFKKKYPGVIIGLSDHTFGHVTTLGAIALGAKVIEKHFTDNNHGSGPDHKFSMTPIAWKKMVADTRLLERALGKEYKKVENNEKETIILQRRSLRASSNLKIGQILKIHNVDILRPAPIGSLPPDYINKILNKKLRKNKKKGENFKLTDFYEN
jgi:N-acetylneuraminate synthase